MYDFLDNNSVSVGSSPSTLRRNVCLHLQGRTAEYKISDKHASGTQTHQNFDFSWLCPVSNINHVMSEVLTAVAMKSTIF
jgi:hypothetical protein